MSSLTERSMGKENPTRILGVKQARTTPKHKFVYQGQENGGMPMSQKKLTELKPVKRALGDVSNTRMFTPISNIPKVSPNLKKKLLSAVTEKKVAKKSCSPRVEDLPEPEMMSKIKPVEEDNYDDLWPLNSGFSSKDMYKLVNFWECCLPARGDSPSPPPRFKIHEEQDEVTSLDLLSPIIKMEDMSSLEEIGDW